MSHKAEIRVADILLRDALRLPADARIRHAEFDPWTAEIRLIVEHPDLPVVPEGAVPPIVVPRFTKAGFEDWGQ